MWLLWALPTREYAWHGGPPTITSIFLIPRNFIIPSMVLKTAGSVSSDSVSLMTVFVTDAGIIFMSSSRLISPERYFPYSARLPEFFR